MNMLQTKLPTDTWVGAAESWQHSLDLDELAPT